MILYRLLADAIVVVHFAFVAFVVLGMLAILVGLWRRWRWVRNFPFRIAHCLAIAFVALESLVGVICPLTTWENQLRELGGGTGQPGSFIGRWVHRLIFLDLPPWVFTACYCLFAAAVLATLILAPPRRPGTKRRG